MRALLRPGLAVLGVVGLILGLVGLGGTVASIGQLPASCTTNGANSTNPVCASASIVAVGQTVNLYVNGSYFDVYDAGSSVLYVLATFSLNGAQTCGQPLSSYLTNCSVEMPVTAHTTESVFPAGASGPFVAGTFTSSLTQALQPTGNYTVTYSIFWLLGLKIWFAYLPIPQVAQVGTSHPFSLPATLPLAQGCTSSGCPTVYAEYSFTTSGLKGTFSDDSHFTNGAKLDGVPGWNFGDGGLSTGVDVTHTFGAPGNYTVTETVTASQPGTAQTLTSVAKRTVYIATPGTTSPGPGGCTKAGSCGNGTTQGNQTIPSSGGAPLLPFLTFPVSAGLTAGFGILLALQVAPAPISGRWWNLVLGVVVLAGTYLGLGGHL